MYCQSCYSELNPAEHHCPHCGRRFDPTNPDTFLSRAFPSSTTVLGQIIGTTIVGILFAFVVAFFQAARASGH